MLALVIVEGYMRSLFHVKQNPRFFLAASALAVTINTEFENHWFGGFLGEDHSSVPTDVTPIFAVYFAGNRSPVPGDSEVRQPANYGFSACLDGDVVELTLTFRAGSAYCCYEWGCHLNLYQGKKWEWLHRELRAAGVDAPTRLKLSLTVTVESGALSFDWSRPKPSRRGRGWYEFAPAEAHMYHAAVAEG
jgi:hypothetical protein